MKQKLHFSILAIVITSAFSSCSSSGSGRYSLGNWEKEARMVSGSTRTPKHSLPKTEYPFDDKGNYISAWAASGERRFGKGHSTWASIIAPMTEAMHASQRIGH